MTVCRSLSVNIPGRNHDFKHSITSIVDALSRLRCLSSVYLACEKTRSGSDDMAGIDKISIAIFDN